MRALMGATIALAWICLSGCSSVSAPSAEFLNRCMLLPVSTNIHLPITFLTKAAEKRAMTTSWSRAPNGEYVLQISTSSSLSAPHLIRTSFQAEGSSSPSFKDCGPGSMRLTGLTFDGEAFDGYESDQTLLMIMEADLRALDAEQTEANSNSAVVSTDPLPQAIGANPSGDVKVEAEADSAFDRNRDNMALRKVVSIADPDASYCCVTVGNVFDELKAQGARVTITTSEDGTIEVDAKGSKPLWRGYKELGLRFGPIAGEPEVVLRLIMSGGQQIASQALNAKIDPDRYFHENFKLSSRPEPSPIG